MADGIRAQDTELARRVASACLGTRVSQLQRLVGRRFDAALRVSGYNRCGGAIARENFKAQPR